MLTVYIQRALELGRTWGHQRALVDGSFSTSRSGLFLFRNQFYANLRA